MTHVEKLQSYKALLDGLLENKDLIRHHENLQTARDLVVDELSKKKPIIDEYMEQIIESILLPIKKESIRQSNFI